MIKKIDAIFDGSVLRPAEPLDIEPNTRVTVDVPETSTGENASFLDTAQELDLDGPADWSENIDAYLYRGRTGSDA